MVLNSEWCLFACNVNREMLRLLWLPQLWPRVPHVITPKLMERPMWLLNTHRLNCSTAPETLDFKKYKRTRAIYGLMSPFKHHYNVENPELMSVIVHTTKLKDVTKTQMDELLSLLKERGYKWEEISKDKEILVLPPNEIRERLRLLEEFCVPRPRLHDVIHVRIYIQSKVSLLRLHNIYDKDFDLVGHLFHKIEKLELPEEVLIKIKNQLEDVENLSLIQIHVYILVHYLAQRFMVDVREAKHLVRAHRLPTWKPLTSYLRICDIIIDTLKMDFSFVTNHPQILNIDPENVLELLRSCPEIGGTPVRELVKEYPQLLTIPHSLLSKWIQLFGNYRATRFKFTSDAVMLFKSQLFKEVEERLQVLYKLPEFEIITMSVRFFELLRKPYAIKRMIDAMHSGQVLSSVQSLFQVPNFKTSRTQSLRALPPEMKSFIAQELGIDEKKDADLALLDEVRTNLGLANTRLVLKLLLDYGFTRDQVLNGIQILSFEYGALKTALEEFPMMPEAQPFDEWMDNPYVIHLLAYFVKKNTPHHW